MRMILKSVSCDTQSFTSMFSENSETNKNKFAEILILMQNLTDATFFPLLHSLSIVTDSMMYNLIQEIIKYNSTKRVLLVVIIALEAFLLCLL
jgi:hypothetical protein